ncbi:glycosyl transferase [Arthrobacter sp. StoSoilA2]|uniref:glycosyltransferase family 2 protein n=1 Tax=Arthrobacter sp. StoSoilA2 TaxID=2830990 RepID=UPI001CC6E11B|nr:glycosyltransferase family 2 protein [Arthrobacter sp. StoSoilA2]BCW36375.1 glycosyl transferase [Arthrobacter sp. StoSoilA2]
MTSIPDGATGVYEAGSGGRVEVLLATRDSGQFLGELLDSLVCQSFRDFHLVVSDDCSRDNTLAILEEAAPRFAHPLRIIRRTAPSGSAAANFAGMLALAQADYVFLADHDDVWLPEKIARGLARMRALEAEEGRETPILLHGDLTPVDAALQVITPSFWAFKAIAPSYGARLNTALMHPTVTGCTVVMNRALVARTGIIPPGAVMHDWWINLVAAAFGRVAWDPDPQILYRIHGGNASNPQPTTLTRALSQWRNLANSRHWIRLRLAQGQAFLNTYRDELPAGSRRVLEAFADIPSAGPISRRRRLIAGGFRSPDLWRNAATLLLV